MVRQIPRDSAKPSGQFFKVPQFVKFFPRNQKGLLGDVFTFMEIAENTV
jgi:hypothetical protein